MKKSKPIDFIRIPVLEILHKILPNNLAVNKKLLKIYANNLMIDRGMNIYDNIPSDRYDQEHYGMNLFSQLRRAEQHNIRFYNFWHTNDISDYWLYNFLMNHDLNEQHLSFFSVFGPKDLVKIKNGAPRIFFSGENVHLDFYKNQGYVDYCLNDCDLSMGCEYIDKPNYLRFPLWIMSFIPANVSYRQIKDMIDGFNTPELRYSGRLKFASMIAGHKAIDGVDREQMTHLFNKIAHIECAGRLLKNTNDLQEKFSNDKYCYLQQFKFNLCPENSSYRGYVTEKLLDSIRAGCIPIYWGDDNPEPEILNHDAIIFYDPNNTQIALDKVSELWQNERLYKEFCYIPPFKVEAADRIWETLRELERRIRVLVE